MLLHAFLICFLIGKFNLQPGKYVSQPIVYFDLLSQLKLHLHFLFRLCLGPAKNSKQPLENKLNQ